MFLRALRPIKSGEEVTIRRVLPSFNNHYFPCNCCICRAEEESERPQFNLLRKTTALLFSTSASSEFESIFERFQKIVTALPEGYPPLTVETYTRAAQYKLASKNFDQAGEFAEIAYTQMLLPESSGVDVVPLIEVCVALRDHFLGDVSLAKLWASRGKRLVFYLGVDTENNTFYQLLTKQLNLKKRS
ncbi:hypothetical protein GEMRC1_011125 [Eukaryota sp. GEM-RC1]